MYATLAHDFSLLHGMPLLLNIDAHWRRNAYNRADKDAASPPPRHEHTFASTMARLGFPHAAPDFAAAGASISLVEGLRTYFFPSYASPK